MHSKRFNKRLIKQRSILLTNKRSYNKTMAKLNLKRKSKDNQKIWIKMYKKQKNKTISSFLVTNNKGIEKIRMSTKI